MDDLGEMDLSKMHFVWKSKKGREHQMQGGLTGFVE